MLVVDPEKRFTIDQCLSHPWMTAEQPGVNDSTDGLVGGVAGLDVNRRGVHRERTLLSSINSVQVTKVDVPAANKNDKEKNGETETIKIYKKNPTAGKTNAAVSAGGKEARPADGRRPDEFMEMGEKGDPELFGNETSNYTKKDVAKKKR